MAYIPGEFESAVFRLDAACRRDRLPPCCVYVCGNGKPTIRQFKKNGTTRTISLIDDEWMQLDPIGGE